MHSVYDLIAGAILGVTMMLFLHSYGDSLDVLLYQYSGAIYVQLLLLMIYFGKTADLESTLFTFPQYLHGVLIYTMHFFRFAPFILLPNTTLHYLYL